MRTTTNAAVGIAFALSLLMVSKAANAFCGFYVAEGEGNKKLYADASQVVMMREGTRTVLSMSNDYKGPPEKFAMVIPVPIVLSKENVKTLPLDAFDKIDKLGSPRLVEYWEQNPCPKPGDMWGDSIGDAFGAGGLGLIGTGAGGGGSGDLGVKIEAKFAVGEYEIVILSAKDAGGLDTWLKQEKYSIPEGAEPYFRPYVQSGMKFFVAKVDPTKVKFADGRAQLSPLRFHYDHESFTLPVRLGLINSSGTQDLIVNILAKKSRYEVANYPNVTIPTNLDVAESARGKFAEFYAALFDATVAKTKNAVVTEYSWDAGTCDPCPGPTLDGEDLATLGADAIPGGTTGLTRGIGQIGGGRGLSGLGGSSPITMRHVDTVVTGGLPKEVVQRIVRQNYGRFRLCYENAVRTNLKAKDGKVVTKFIIARDGSVATVSDGGGTEVDDQGALQCMRKGFASLSFPNPETNAPVTVVYTFAVTNPGDASVPPPAPSPPPPPVFSSMATPYVLTRLHVRYSKESMGQDLIFKEAPAISGGREVMSNGVLEKGAVPAPTNNFQGRYAIRHPWTGPIECKEPRRNVWGGPPRDLPDGGNAALPAFKPAPVPAQKTAFVARGGLSLAAMIAPTSHGDVTDAGVALGPIPQSTTGSSGTTGDAGAAGADAAKKSGCGSCATAESSSLWPAGLGMGIALATLHRRRARRRRVTP